ncbi:MAG: TetR/AcrR family transcriptional regulator [Thiohalocapsa sp.]
MHDPIPQMLTKRAGRQRSSEKREAILEAASRLFLQRGLQGASMDRVAKEAGVSKQTVYAHFENKDELFCACIRDKVTSHGFDGNAMPTGESAREILLAMVRQFMRLIFDPEVVSMYRVVTAEAVAHPRIAALFYETGPQATVAAVANALQALVARGLLREHDSVAGAWRLLNMCFGSFHVRLLLNLIEQVPREELDAHLRLVVEDFIALYGTQP